MARYTNTVRDQNGRPIVRAFVSVLTQSGDTATLFDDASLPLANPVQTDSYGGYIFNTTEGIYDLEITFGGRTVWIERNVYIGTDPANYFKGDQGNPGGNIGAIGPKTGATGMAIPTGVTMVRTSCYAVPGDGGQADYALIGADNTQLPASAKFADSQGRYWAISVQGAVQIEQFGGRCDCPWVSFEYGTTGFTGSYAAPTPGTVTDNLQPFYDAEKTVNAAFPAPLRIEAGSLIPIEFKRSFDTTKCYWFSDTIIPQYSPHIRGNNSGTDTLMVGTIFRFPPNTIGLKLNLGPHQPAGYVKKSVGSGIVHGIWFQGGGGTNRNAHGLHHTVSVKLENCVFDSFAGYNNYNIGYIGLADSDPRKGLTSGSHYNNVVCRAAGMWNTWIEGSDVSASQFDQLQHKVSRLGGLMDLGFFANTFNNYGNHGHGSGLLGSVKHGGRRYALIDPSAGIGGATTPGTNDRVWEDYGLDDGSSSTYWPTWSSGGTYAVSVPSYIAYSGTVLDGYIENYYLKQVGGTLTGTPFPGRYTTAIGSDPASGFDTLHNSNVGVRYDVPPSNADFPVVGNKVERRLTGGKAIPSIIDSWASAKTPSGWTMQYVNGGRIRVGIAFVGSGSPMAYELLDGNTTATLGRATAQPGFIVTSNFALGNANGGGDARIHETFNGPPPSATGRANGEMLYRNDPPIGGAAIYTVAGSTMQPVGIVGAVQAAPQANSTATTIAALKDDLNALLAKLRAANLMQP